MQLRIDTDRWRPDWRGAIALGGPCVVLVTAHFLFHYAKYVRPFYERGFPYLGAAAVETGLYLLLPLAILALVKGWRARRDLTHALPCLCMVPHMVGIARMGGDVFWNRPLDVYWPLLAVSVAEGVVYLSMCASSAIARRWPFALGHLTVEGGDGLVRSSFFCRWCSTAVPSKLCCCSDIKFAYPTLRRTSAGS